MGVQIIANAQKTGRIYVHNISDVRNNAVEIWDVVRFYRLSRYSDGVMPVTLRNALLNELLEEKPALRPMATKV